MTQYLEENELNISQLGEAASLINKILSDYRKEKKEYITPKDIIFTPQFLAEVLMKNEKGELTRKRKLSDIVFDTYYPKPQSNEFYHFTKLSALEGILKGNLRLSKLKKNIDYHEYLKFYRDHNDEEQIYHDSIKDCTEIIETSFVFSFAMAENFSQENDSHLWRNFADKGAGVKIKFSLETTHEDFRSIFYRKGVEKSQLLINILNRQLFEKYKRRLFLMGISKIGAFYLPGDYNIENEVRLLIKKDTDSYQFNFDIQNGYIELQFDSSYAKIKILKVVGGRDTERKILENVLISKGLDPKNMLEMQI